MGGTTPFTTSPFRGRCLGGKAGGFSLLADGEELEEVSPRSVGGSIPGKVACCLHSNFDGKVYAK